MKKMMKVLSVAAISASLLLAGCAGKDTNTTAGKSVSGSLPAPGDFKQNLTLKLSGSFTRGKVEDGNYVQKRLEKQFNVKIVNTKADTWNTDQVNLMVASGDLPDTFAFTAGGKSPKELYDAGLTRTIPKAMLEKYAPRYMKMLSENPPGLKMNLVKGKDNEYYSLTGLYSHVDGLTWAPTFRLDWLEKLGIKPPGEIKQVGPSGGRQNIYYTDKAYTIDQVEQILKAFTFDDPDGDGKKDTYGLSPYNNQTSWATTLMGAFGIAPGYNFMENGKLVTTEISQKYKDFLKTMNKWYKEGIIDPEFTTLDVNKSWEKYKQGKIGYYIAQPAYAAMDDWAKGRAPQNIEEDPNSTAKLLVTAPEIGKNGQQGEGAFLPVGNLADNLFVSKKVTDEQLARILQIFDYINFDDSARWTMYGEVGVHSDWEGTPNKSALKVRKGFAEQEGNSGFYAYNFRTYDMERVQWFTSEYTMNLKKAFFARPDVKSKMLIRPYKWDLLNQTNLADVNKRYQGQLKTIEDEFRMKAIVGEVNIDKDWDNYVQNWMNSGGKEVLAELNKAQKVSDLMKK